MGGRTTGFGQRRRPSRADLETVWLRVTSAMEGFFCQKRGRGALSSERSTFEVLLGWGMGESVFPPIVWRGFVIYLGGGGAGDVKAAVADDLRTTEKGLLDFCSFFVPIWLFFWSFSGCFLVVFCSSLFAMWKFVWGWGGRKRETETKH